MKKTSSQIICKLAISIIFISVACPLYSQSDIERATHETDRLGREEKGALEEELRQPPEKPAEEKLEVIPVEKEEEKFFIKRIDLSGVESFSTEDFSFLIQKYENKEVALSDLNTLAKEIEREYLRKGVIAAVIVPPQEIKEGTVILQVIEAKMGELGIEEHRYFKKARLKYYWKVKRGEVMRYDRIYKSIQLMNKNPDRKVKSSIYAGKTPGTTDVSLTAQTNFPAHFTSTFDREGSISSGRGRQGYGLRHNNFLGLDDTLIGGYTLGRDFSGFYTYHTLPVTSEGASLLYGYSRSVSIPTKEFTVNGLKSNAKNTSLSWHQDLYKKGDYLGEVSLGFEAKDKTTWTNTGVYNKDRLRVFSLGSNFLQRGVGSSTYFSPELSQGVDAFGASSKGNPLASRGAKSNFTKFNLGLQHRRILPLNMQASLRFKAQVASVKLMPQEEFALGGIDSVRGYPSGDYLADNAVSNNIELLIPGFLIPQNWRLPYAQHPLREQTTFLAFLDYGWGSRKGALPSEHRDVNLFSIGTGIRINLFNQAFLRIEWGMPLGGNRPITEKGNSRIHFSIDFQDKLPEEIARIKKLRKEKT